MKRKCQWKRAQGKQLELLIDWPRTTESASRMEPMEVLHTSNHVSDLEVLIGYFQLYIFITDVDSA